MISISKKLCHKHIFLEIPLKKKRKYINFKKIDDIDCTKPIQSFIREFFGLKGCPE